MTQQSASTAGNAVTTVPVSSTKVPALQSFTFSAPVAKMLRPIIQGKKRVGLLKVTSRVRGKIVASETGKRFIVIEQIGRDVWCGKHKTLNEAVAAGDAAIAIDKILLQRAIKYDVKSVAVVVTDLRRLYVSSIDTFLDTEKARTRSDWRGRAIRVVGFEHLMCHYLGADLRRKKKRASA